MPAQFRSRPWVAYVVAFPYPWGEAGSRRVHGICRSIVATGRDVLVIALPTPGTPYVAGSRLVIADSRSGGCVRTISRKALPASALRRQWAHHVSGARDALDLIERVSPYRPSHVIVYGTLTTPLLQVLRWGRANGVSVLADIVERYSPRQFRGGALSPGYVLSTAGFELVAPQLDGVIAISRHIESYFVAHGVRTLRIPPTVDLSQIPRGEPSSDRMTFGYFGSPGRKDLLAVVVEAFVRGRRASGRDDLRLIIGGDGTRAAASSRKGQGLEGVEFLGRIPQHEVSAVLGSLHATMLARPRARYAEAGYPTKVVESLSVGTPVLCNLTGDLGEVIREGETGWISSGPSINEMASAFSRAAGTSHEDLVRMRQSSRSTAEEWFDAARYAGRLDEHLVATA